ncbi:GntR family transcriptional regulator [Streptomyces sp. NPDC127038]|uniref:GntR family transcriptional regulator n=1 Tax=Streptomyces sp. NPDC127038 TaxID=3347114 RepID=UPI0036521D0D
MLAGDRDSAVAASLVEGLEPGDTVLRSGRYQRHGTVELLSDLPAPATLPAADDGAATAGRGAPPPPDTSLPMTSPQRPADVPQSTMVVLPPRLAEAFAAPEVRVDAVCLTAETLMLALGEPVRLIHEGRILPRSIDVRILLPSREINLAFPISVMSPGGGSAQIPDDPVHQRWLEQRNVQGHVLRHNLLGLRTSHGIDVRVAFRALPFTPPMKVYLLNETEALMAYYMLARREEEVESQILDMYDTVGAASLLFSFNRQAGGRDAAYVDQSQRWFDSVWETIASDLTLS